MYQPPENQPPQSYPYPPQQPSQPYDTNAPTWQPSLTPPPPPMASYPYGAPPPSQRPRRRRKWPWVVTGVLLVLIVIIAVAANSGGGNAPASSSTPTAQANATTAPTQAARPTVAPTVAGNKIGVPASLSGWTVTINGAKRDPGDGQFNVPKAGNVYLMIDVTIVNGTGQSQTVSSLGQFALKDASGQTYTESIDTAAPNAPDGPVANGAKLRGTLTYEVPAGNHAWEFDFTPDAFGTDQITWNLSV